MVERRTYLATVGAAVTGATAGCGFVLGTEPATFSADASAVPESVLSETGYEHEGTENMRIEREFSAGGQTRNVVARNVLAKHEKAIDLGPLGEQRAGVFSSLTTPKVEVLGETFNPIEDMSAADLAKTVQDRYDEFSNLQQRGESEVTINDSTTTQVTFASDAALSGNPVEIYLQVSEAVGLGGDFVVTFGSYPARNAGTEEPNVVRMMEAVESA